MAGFDRSKWKAAPLTTVNATVNETKKFDTYFESGNNEYARFWTNRDGITVKRVLPAHEPGDSPYVPMLTAMLKIEVDDKDSNGTVIGKKVANKKIFIGTLHGGYPYDIIEEYIKRVYEKADAYQGDERDRYLNPVKGYRMGGKNGTWVPGIRPQLEYVFYALIEGKIYRDSLKPKQMEALNKESADLCAQNDTAAIDMFSDPTTGFPIQWSVGKDKDGKKETTLKSLPLKMQQTWDEYFGENAVPDAILEQLEKLPSLKSLYVDSYKKRDFDLALEGLKRFDEANVYKIFADEEFLDMVEQMAEMVAEKTGDDGKPSGTDDLPFGDEAPSAAPAPAAKKTPVAKAPAAKKNPLNRHLKKNLLLSTLNLCANTVTVMTNLHLRTWVTNWKKRTNLHSRKRIWVMIYLTLMVGMAMVIMARTKLQPKTLNRNKLRQHQRFAPQSVRQQ